MFQHCNNLKDLRMALALDLHHKAQTQHIYEAIDEALERAAYLAVLAYQENRVIIEDVNELEFPPI